MKLDAWSASIVAVGLCLAASMACAAVSEGVWARILVLPALVFVGLALGLAGRRP